MNEALKLHSLDNMQAVALDDAAGRLVILDQTLLPNQTVYLELSTKDDIYEAILKLRVRGAPAIGIAAAYGIYLVARNSNAKDFVGLHEEFTSAKNFLASARPTAVNLFWALDRMENCFYKNSEKSNDEIKKALLEESKAIHNEDIEMCRTIGQYGLSLLRPNMGLLTHCNAGQLATSKFGTALSPIYLGYERGYGFKVFADETRPLLQGARLTAYELQTAGVDVTLICDNMASIVMKKGLVDAVLVGCDRVATNGDTANKIGTSGVAILAKNYGIPFYVCAPSSTIDLNCPDGGCITIEERDPLEVTEAWYKKRMAPDNVKVYNPAFDVTDAEFITAIITERGILTPPFGPSIKNIFDRD